MQKHISRSLKIERLKSIAITLQENESFGPAILVGIAAIAFFLAVPFYGILAAIVLAIICGGASYFRPHAGMSFTLILGLFAIAFHSTGIAWLYAFIFLGSAIFEIRTSWRFYAYLILAVSGAFLQFPFAGVISFIALAFGCLQLGSHKSLVLTVSLVFFVLLLSSLWETPNNMGMTVGHMENFTPFEASLSLQTGDTVSLPSLPMAMINSMASMFSWDGLTSLFGALGKSASNTIVLLIAGPLFILSGAFAACGYAIGYLPIKLKEHQFAQAIATVPILLPAIAIALTSSIYSAFIESMAVIYAIIAIVASLALDLSKTSISREKAILASQTQTKFGKFGEEKIQVTDISLSDIGGYGDVKDELMDAIAGPLQNKAVATAYGLKPASGVLLFGPPGTGKTLLMKALATELGLRFVSISCTDILSSWHGESESNVKEIFKTARKNAPCILFFDEIEALAKSRDKFFGDDVGPRVLSVLLQEMDGFAKKQHSKPVIVVGATNLPNQLDAAIMRPGRLDKIIYMSLPDSAARKKIFEVHSSKLPLADDLDLDALTQMSEGYSGADIANIVSEASRLAAREARVKNKIVPISQKHFLSVLKQVKPSTSQHQIAMYKKFGDEFERSVRGQA